MRPLNRIVGSTLRVTADPRTPEQKEAGDRLAQRAIERAAWLAELLAEPPARDDDNVIDIAFGSASK